MEFSSGGSARALLMWAPRAEAKDISSSSLAHLSELVSSRVSRYMSSISSTYYITMGTCCDPALIWRLSARFCVLT